MTKLQSNATDGSPLAGTMEESGRQSKFTVLFKKRTFMMERVSPHGPNWKGESRSEISTSALAASHVASSQCLMAYCFFKSKIKGPSARSVLHIE